MSVSGEQELKTEIEIKCKNDCENSFKFETEKSRLYSIKGQLCQGYSNINSELEPVCNLYMNQHQEFRQEVIMEYAEKNASWMILGGVMIGVLILVCVYKTACCKLLPRCSHVLTGKRRGKKLEAKSFHRSVDEINGKIGRLLDHTDGISPVSVNNPTNSWTLKKSSLFKG